MVVEVCTKGIACESFGRSMLSDHDEAHLRQRPTVHRLNAPYGAWCFLRRSGLQRPQPEGNPCPNAPYGARCVPTVPVLRLESDTHVLRLNAPFGARCFLTHDMSPALANRLWS